jgi:hypothetical protein
LKWSSPREGEEDAPISFRVERTIAERDRGRALSKSWALLAPVVKDSRGWRPGMKLITDAARGTIAIATGLDMWELVELRPVGDEFSVRTFDANLLHFGVGPATAESIRASLAKPTPAPAAPTATTAAAAAAGGLDDM